MYVQIVPIQIQPQINRCLCEEVCCCTRKWLRWKVQFVIIGRHLVVAEWKEPKTKSNSKTASEYILYVLWLNKDKYTSTFFFPSKYRAT